MSKVIVPISYSLGTADMDLSGSDLNCNTSDTLLVQLRWLSKIWASVGPVPMPCAVNPTGDFQIKHRFLLNPIEVIKQF